MGRRHRWHPVRPVPRRWRAAQHRGEDRRRRRTRCAHPEQRGDLAARALGRPGRSRRPPSPCRGSVDRLRRHELEHLPGQPVHHRRRHAVVQVRQPGQLRPGGPPGRRRPQPICDRPRRPAGVGGDHRVVGRRDQPSRPGRSPHPVRAGRRRARGDPRPPPRRMADVHGAQAVRARLLRHGEPRLGIVAAAGAGSRSEGVLPGRPRPSPPQRQHRADRQPARHGRSARRLPLQRLQVRRRRPDHRVDQGRSSSS